MSATAFMTIISGLFEPAAKLIDELHTSDDERLEAKRKMLRLETDLTMFYITKEADALQMRGDIVNSEAKSDHWLTATWRPITMLTFLALVVGDSLGLLPNGLNEQAWTLLQIGLGGYVVGRTGEKVMSKRNQAKREERQAKHWDQNHG